MHKKILNFNVGVLGHVDSGKTSLAKALSTTASTASFDKNPQSKERGITLDLGFSSFTVDFPPNLKTPDTTYEKLQFTLVDCPGHASLIKTIIGGAQIIDLMMLVIDVTKGVQTQTAECLIIGEITCDKMLVVLNKIDLLPNDKREASIEKMKKRMLLTLQNTKFKNSPIVTVSATPAADEGSQPLGIAELIETLTKSAFVPERKDSGPFLFAVDHCFGIRGQGTVMTGTVLQGKVSVNDTVEIPNLKITRKVKSIQMFRQPVDSAIQGDRIGLCVTQFDPKLLERGLACTAGTLPDAHAVVVSIARVPYFKQQISSKSKFHITIGHETVMARVNLFASQDPDFSLDLEYPYADEVQTEVQAETSHHYFALLQLERPICVTTNGLVLGSKFDTDIHSNSCRIAFSGRILHIFENSDYLTKDLPKLKVYKIKCKEGIVERMTSAQEAIGKNVFKKETNIQLFVGFKVTLSTGEEGFIDGSFGQSGKVKLRFMSGLSEPTQALLGSAKKKGAKPNPSDDKPETVRFTLKFKRYIYDTEKKMIQK